MDNEFIVSDDEMEEAFELAFELDESFRQKSEEYRNKYPDSQKLKEEMADRLFENNTSEIKNGFSIRGKTPVRSYIQNLTYISMSFIQIMRSA